MKTKNSISELEKSTRDLLLSILDILSVGGSPYLDAVESIALLLKSTPLLDPENIRRQAFYLADQRDDILRKMSALLDKDARLITDRDTLVKLKDDVLPQEISALLISLIKQIVSLRPNYYHDLIAALIKQIEVGSQLAEILSGFLDLIIQVREDLWEERSKAFKHIEHILKTLEDTEKNFIASLSNNQAYLIDNDEKFNLAMEKGLIEIGSIASQSDGPPHNLEEMCLEILEKVNNLHDFISEKRYMAKEHLKLLNQEKELVEKRLRLSKRDYDEFLRQSHEMLKEIETLKAISLHDPLTEIYNRRAYDKQMPKTLAAYKSGHLKTSSMIVFDIDNFKEFNNDYGHLAGDRILAYVVRLTRKVLRGDDLIFRYGGDEFVILMLNAPIKAAMVVAEKVRRSINAVEFKLFKNSDITARVSVSMGVAEIKENDDLASFFARADRAMYEAKKQGRNRITSHT